MKQKINLDVENEYGKLKKVLMADGTNIVADKFSLKYLEKYGGSMAREIKYHPETSDVNVPLALKQHQEFIDLIKSKGVEIFFTRNIKNATDQVFTRDPGFVIDDIFYQSLMGDPIRKIEQKGFSFFLSKFKNFKKLKGSGILEGGDVILNNKKIYIGITFHSTDWQGFKVLKKEMEERDKECVFIRCGENVLHLDCRFNILAPDLALAYKKDIFSKDYEKLKKDFQIIELRDSEVSTYAANIFMLSEKEVVLEKRNKRIAKILRSLGFEVYEIDYSEITKMWGAFRCTTLPLKRE